MSTHLADGPAMYLGGSIMTFALPYAAFIVIAVVLFYLFRAKHSGPRLKYLVTSPFTAIGTREPGPVPAPPVAAPPEELAADPEVMAGTEIIPGPDVTGEPETAATEPAPPEAGE